MNSGQATKKGANIRLHFFYNNVKKNLIPYREKTIIFDDESIVNFNFRCGGEDEVL